MRNARISDLNGMIESEWYRTVALRYVVDRNEVVAEVLVGDWG